MEPYEHEIRLITMSQSPIKVDIPKNITLYEIDMDSTNFESKQASFYWTCGE